MYEWMNQEFLLKEALLWQLAICSLHRFYFITDYLNKNKEKFCSNPYCNKKEKIGQNTTVYR